MLRQRLPCTMQLSINTSKSELVVVAREPRQSKLDAEMKELTGQVCHILATV